MYILFITRYYEFSLSFLFFQLYSVVYQNVMFVVRMTLYLKKFQLILANVLAFVETIVLCIDFV